jgi:sulfite reductase beta subunit-like hemoprotein
MHFDPKMTKNEHLKQAKDGLDTWDDIARFAKEGYSSISEEDMTRLRWYGIYEQKPNEGHFMWRIKLPGGRLTPAQLRIIGRLAQDYARGFGDITTRQDIQLHWMTIENFPDAFDRIYRQAGLYTTFACGDTPRNTTSCPLDGVLKNQIVPLGDLVQRVSDMYRDAGKELSNLPRKFKTALAACPLHCHQPQINDLASFGVVRQRDGQRGLGLVVGGGLSSEPYYAQGLRVLIPQDQLQRIPEIYRQVALIFRDSDELRYKRKHARLKFLVAQKGWQWFRDELERRLGYALEHDESIVNPSGALHTDHMGVGEQADGLYYVGVPVARGRWTAAQMIAIADLAQRFAADDRAQIRLSQKQNALLLNIPKSNVDALRRELEQIGLPAHSLPWRQALVSCTGTQFCNLAVVETKERAAEILRYLEQQVQLDTPIMVSVTGCPNSCAQYQIADIGLTGIPVIYEGRKQDGFNLLVGGCLGDKPEFGRELLPKIPASLVPKVIVALVRGYLAHRVVDTDGEAEPFRDFVARCQLDELRQMATIAEWTPPPARARV